MRSRKLTNRRGLANQDLDTWPQVNTAALSEKHIQVFNRRSLAIRMYAQQNSLKSIEMTTGIDRASLYRLIERCGETDIDGKIAGFRGLVPYRQNTLLRNNNPKKLISRAPKPGALSALFSSYPYIREQLFEYAILGKLEGLRSREISPATADIHSKFLELCEKSGITSPHYPFNSQSLGKPAIARWVAKTRLNESIKYLGSTQPQLAAHVRSFSDAMLASEPVTRCYQRVECDGHQIDLHCMIEIPSPTGEGVIFRKISRLWIIVLIEVMSRAVIGYTFSFGRNYSAIDIMRAVRNSMLPWKRRDLVVKSIGYRDGDGLPNGMIEELSYACFDELWLDNAKAHLSRLFLNNLERTVGAVPVFGPVATPNARPFIEAFFNVLEEAGIHRTIGTTGSYPQDPRGATHLHKLEAHLSFEMLADFIDISIARINGSPGPDSSISRLEVLRRVATRRTAIIRRIPATARESAFRYDIFEEGKIGRDSQRACVRFHGARYFNDLLSASMSLIGKTVTIAALSEDMRHIEGFLEDGSSLGILTVERRWMETRHSLITRIEVIRLQNKKHKFIGDDLPRAFRHELEEKARTSKLAAAALERVRIEQKEVNAPLMQKGNNALNDINEAEPFNDPQNRNSDAVKEMEYAEIERRLTNVRTQYRR